MSDIGRVLVIGATGHIGGHAVGELRARGSAVRGLARRPAGLPVGVEAVAGDLADPGVLRTALDGVDAVLLIWPWMTAEAAPAVLSAMEAAGVRRVAYVSSLNVRDGEPPEQGGVWAQVEDAIGRTGLERTFLRASGFATNTLAWAAAVRAGAPVRIPYPAASRSLVHEADIAAVAAAVLTEPGHGGAAYRLTGPRSITQTEQVEIIAGVAGHPVPIEEQTREEARAGILAWADPAFADSSLAYWASLVESPEPVTTAVADLTGTPARDFRQWAVDHAADFRA